MIIVANILKKMIDQNVSNRDKTILTTNPDWIPEKVQWARWKRAWAKEWKKINKRSFQKRSSITKYVLLFFRLCTLCNALS